MKKTILIFTALICIACLRAQALDCDNLGSKLSVTTPLSTKDVTRCEGDPVGVTDGDMSFVVANATKYVWEKDSAGIRVLLPDTTSQLKRAYLLPNDSGRYYVTASNRCSKLKDSVHLTVNPLPRVTKNPKNPTSVYIGDQIMLTAASTNAATKQWLFNGRKMSDSEADRVRGVASDTLRIGWANPLKHTGKYCYTVENGCGEDTSTCVTVTVVDTTKLDVQIVKIARNMAGVETDSVAVDSLITFTLCVTNNSLRRVHHITVIDTLPAGFEFILDKSIVDKVNATGRVLNFEIADSLCARTEVEDCPNMIEFTYTVRAIKPGTYYNRVYAGCPDAATMYNTSSVTPVTVGQFGGDLAITKEIIKVETNPIFLGEDTPQYRDGITVGDLVTYRITVKNVGVGAITNIRVSDFLPVSSVMYIADWIPAGLNGTMSDGELSVDAKGITLNSGQQFEFEVTVKMIKEGYYTLPADVTLDDYETDTINNHAEAMVYVRGLRIPPMVITPNDDGIDDFFAIHIGLTYPNNELFVYSCRGDLAYRKKNYYNQLKGDALPSGTYIYAFRFVDEYGKTHQLNGSMVVKSYIELDEIIPSKYDTIRYDTMHIYDTTYIYDSTCPDDSSINTTITLAEQSLIKLYPNPTSGYLIVESEELRVGEVVNVYSLSGVLMITYQIEGEKTSINVSHLPSGAYLLRAGKRTARFVKQ